MGGRDHIYIYIYIGEVAQKFSGVLGRWPRIFWGFGEVTQKISGVLGRWRAPREKTWKRRIKNKQGLICYSALLFNYET